MPLASFFDRYTKNLSDQLATVDRGAISRLFALIKETKAANAHLFVCGNGGSAANAIHMVNDFLYGGFAGAEGFKATALPANQAVLTCMGNDLGYENIFSRQLETLSQSGDALLVLSGSGNSPNIVNALETAKSRGVKTAAIVGFDGRKCKELADIVVHFPIADMQIAEDAQIIVAHILIRMLQEEAMG